MNGTGNFAFGYFGGVMDAATGLLYVGNGQYYDPATGRFLTGDARPNSGNPYLPWDPTGVIVGPLAAIALFFGGKKKGSKTGTFLVLLLVLGSVGMTLAACGSSAQATAVVTPTMTYVAVSTAATTIYTATPTATLPPSLTPEVLCPPIPTTGVAPANLGTEADFFTPVTDGKDAFLQAVLRHQNELPQGMTVKLLLAMGAAESGAANGWCQECLNGGGPLNSGVLQVDPDSGFKWKS